MEEQLENYLVSVHRYGTRMDVVEKREFGSEKLAKDFFKKYSKRLLEVNRWGAFAGLSAFQLITNKGIRKQGQAVVGDFIRIDIPGPGSQNGRGYDWVIIEEIGEFNSENSQVLAMRVRPCPHPLSKEEGVAHFLTAEATSTFLIRQKGNAVFSQEHGRNEIANTQQGNLYDKGRNFAVGMAAKLGLSFPQWKSLLKGLIFGSD
ncbi:hypothetical protein [Pedobacter aquatilis]|uniref:hypothetical protein n=1 Tax=Pedobacter aquatilis TaxID=351343 RepID=UPI00293030D6|nr:hypothetical protein [Pedobacter aquatilis]